MNVLMICETVGSVQFLGTVRQRAALHGAAHFAAHVRHPEARAEVGAALGDAIQAGACVRAVELEVLAVLGAVVGAVFGHVHVVNFVAKHRRPFRAEKEHEKQRSFSAKHH